MTSAANSPPGGGRVAWHCACFNTRRAARAVTRFYDSVLAPAGVTATQFTLLGALSVTGAAAISRLADALALDRTTLTRNLALLERDGLIVSAPGADRRARIVSLTGAGEDAVARALPYWREAQRRIVGHFGDERWRGLGADLSELAALAAQPEN